MYRCILLFAVSNISAWATSETYAAKPQITLLGTISKWQYPGAKIGSSMMSGGETFNSAGERTVPSSLLQTTMTTPDSAEKVVAFYRKLLGPGSKRLPIAKNADRSVLFRDASDDFRSASGELPYAMHVILVNSPEVSTTMIVTRAKSDKLTKVVWQQYIRHNLPRKHEAEASEQNQQHATEKP